MDIGVATLDARKPRILVTMIPRYADTMIKPAALSDEQISQLTDDELRAVYLSTSQEADDPEVERLIPEMARRDLGF